MNKPLGLSSSEVVIKVKRILDLRKVGHLGTLDPFATGVLPLCVNEGTKLAPFLMESEKEYIGILRLGIETDTQDSQGRILRQSAQIPCDSKKITQIFKEFEGETQQIPPMFSALKYRGVPLYKIARQGGWVPRQPRSIIIKRIEILKFKIPFITFRVVCSRGTYIRTLCSDIGEKLSCGAHLAGLKRIRNGSFHIYDAMQIDVLKIKAQNGSITKYLISPNEALKDLPEIVSEPKLLRKIQHGSQITINDLHGLNVPPLKAGQKMKILSPEGSLAGIVESLINDDALATRYSHLKVLKVLRVFLN
jgi:tRNA pseudouridine55 synthase